MLKDTFKDHRIILASQSPRRQRLLSELGIPFEIVTRSVEEEFPPGMDHREVAAYLAGIKADAFRPDEFGENAVIITADTVVLLDDELLAKPEDAESAARMLRKLSGRKHEVMTGVCILTSRGKHVFVSCTDVWFKRLSEEEIRYYIQECRPFDKAGAYGIQEWIGYIGITRIEGSYFNVMGLPVQQLYHELLRVTV